MYVICCGMYRSGSTWQYLVASDLVEAASRGRRIGFVTGDSFNDVAQHLDDPSQTFVLKCHDFHPLYGDLIAQGRAKAVYSYRDIRDVACSLMWKLRFSFGQTMASDAFRAALDSYYKWIAVPDRLIQYYETLVHNPSAAVAEIASYLSIDIDEARTCEIVQKNSLESNKKRIESLAEMLAQQGVDLSSAANALLYDHETLLHWNHLRPSTALSWRTTLGFDELMAMRPIIQSWLTDAGFEEDDTWVFEPFLRSLAPENGVMLKQMIQAYRQSILDDMMKSG